MASGQLPAIGQGAPGAGFNPNNPFATGTLPPDRQGGQQWAPRGAPQSPWSMGPSQFPVDIAFADGVAYASN